MKHRFRFYGRRSPEGTWQLDDEEWHHLIKVLRLKPQTPLEICNGEGWLAEAVLLDLGKTSGNFSISSESFSPQTQQSSRLVLAMGVLKQQSMDDTLPALVELGVDRIALLHFQGMDKARLSAKLIERWRRIIVAAGKQSKARWFPDLVAYPTLQSFIDEAQSGSWTGILLDPEAKLAVAELGEKVSGPLIAVIGSEQGWSTEENTQLAKVFKPVRLNSNILRATTAAAAAAAIFKQKLPDQAL